MRARIKASRAILECGLWLTTFSYGCWSIIYVVGAITWAGEWVRVRARVKLRVHKITELCIRGPHKYIEMMIMSGSQEGLNEEGNWMANIHMVILYLWLLFSQVDMYQ